MNSDVTIERLVAHPASKNGHFALSMGRLKEFIAVAWNVPFYQTKGSQKVMPILLAEMNDLNPDRTRWKLKFPGANPFFRHCSYVQYYIARRNGESIGRIAAFIDTSYHESSVSGDIGWIGLFECIDDDQTARALLGAATADLQEQGAVKIIGPARFNANGEDGLLIEGFDEHPMVMEPYHAPYYARFLEQWGVKENDWYAFRITGDTVRPYMARLEGMRERGQDLEKRVLREGVSIRSVRLQDWDDEIARIKTVYNKAWNTSVHPQFEQFSVEEFDYLAASLRNIAIEDLVFVAEDITKPGHPVIGMAVTLPDLNEVIDEYDGQRRQFKPSRHTYGLSDLRRDMGILRLLRKRVKAKKFTHARVFVLGTMRKKSGIDAVLYERTYLAGKKMGITLGSGSQVADTNPEIYNPLSRMGTAAITWRIYRYEDRRPTAE